MTRDVLTVLDGVQVDLADEISAADCAYCERIQAQYDNVKSMLAGIGNANNEIINRTILEEGNEHNEWRSLFRDIGYEAAKIAEIIKADGREVFVNRIANYFATVYCVDAIHKIDFRTLHEKLDLSWRDVLHLILKEAEERAGSFEPILLHGKGARVVAHGRRLDADRAEDISARRVF